jgi:hypothetical protein
MVRTRYAATYCVILVVALALVACADEGGRQAMDGQESSKTAAQGDPIRLLFIHHSCGGQLLSDPGEKVGGARGSGERCIYVSHPNGGGLRSKLGAAGYEVHEASYESIVGADTDIDHWRDKFSTMMDRILRTDRQDRTYDDDRTNSIVVFKSCYPNNDFVGPGVEPGDPDSSERTVANAKAAYRSLLPIFAERPDVLFMAVTAPPRAEPKKSAKEKLGSIFKKKETEPADWAREFNTWMADAENGWLGGYQLSNVAVFDYYDVLTKHGETNWSAYATGGGRDSHPSREGNTAAASRFVDVLDRAVAAMDPAR